MSREKKFVIAAGTFAGIATVLFIVKKFRHRSEFKELTREERELVALMLKSPSLARLKSDIEAEVQGLPDDERLSMTRTRVREFLQSIGDD